MGDTVGMANKINKSKSTKYNLTIEEVYKILTTDSMKKLKCNFKVYKHSGGKHPKTSGRKAPAWFNKFHEEEFKPLVEKVNRMQNKPPKYFTDFANQMLAFVKRQEEFNKMILSRIDNLVVKNNLKE